MSEHRVSIVKTEDPYSQAAELALRDMFPGQLLHRVGSMGPLSRDPRRTLRRNPHQQGVYHLGWCRQWYQSAQLGDHAFVCGDVLRLY